MEYICSFQKKAVNLHAEREGISLVKLTELIVYATEKIS